MLDQDALLEVFITFEQRATGTFSIEAILRELASAAGRVLAVEGAGVAYRVASPYGDGRAGQRIADLARGAARRPTTIHAAT